MIASPLNDPAIQQKYVVTSGHSGYYGSTTAGEMRELCDTRTPYQEITKELAQQCLPAQLHRKGYATLAFHGFSGQMFDRTDWYPALSFDKTTFGEDLLPNVTRRCGSAFRGPCDADVAKVIGDEAAKTKKPNFIYWVTLNTHIPVAPGDARANFNCEKDSTVFRRPGVCRMGELWHDLFDGIAKLALDPALAPAEILIVGDHAPPLWSRAGREMFVPGQVAWYRLTPRQ
jgi:phosphoglycerol transferase MdoB-like AlkP superfamily enzyme